MMRALAVRIAVSVLLFACIVIAWSLGWIHPDRHSRRSLNAGSIGDASEGAPVKTSASASGPPPGRSQGGPRPLGGSERSERGG